MPRWRLALYSTTTILLLLAAIELALGLAGVTPMATREDPYLGFSASSALFSEEQRGDEIWMTTAPAKRPFFNEQSFPRRKPAGTYRIFCLGGSTTYGHPWTHTLSFCGWLQRFLTAADPSRQWQVINAGGISYASYRVAALMTELVNYDPDLFIVYTGQNEFIEARSYGHLRDLPAWLVEANTLLAHSRLFTVLRQLVVRANDQPRLGAEVEERLAKTIGPESYYRDDAERVAIVRHFRFNLARMSGLARDQGARFTLVMPASNLKDMGPFKSQNSLTGKAAEAWQARYATALATPDPAARLALLERLAGEDPRYAALHFERGRILLALKRTDEARLAFLRAVEEDVAPLRMLPEMANILRTLAVQEQIPLVDFAALMDEAARRSTGHAIPGQEWFVDHVHPTIEGYRQLGLALLDHLQQLGVVKGRLDEAKLANLTAEALGTLDQAANGRALMNLGIVLGWAGRIDEAHRLLLDAQRQMGDDLHLLLRLGLSAERLKRPQEAARFYHQAASAFPASADPWRRLADLAHQAGDAAAERQHRAAAIERAPDATDDVAALAELLAAQGEWDEAVKQYRDLARRAPGSPAAHVNLGVALANVGNATDARAAFEAALRLDPTDTDTYLGLAALAQGAGDTTKARELFTKAVQHGPAHAPAHLSFGAFLANTGQPAAAIPLFETAARLDPTSADAEQNLALALRQTGREPEARPHFAAARRLRSTP